MIPLLVEVILRRQVNVINSSSIVDSFKVLCLIYNIYVYIYLYMVSQIAVFCSFCFTQLALRFIPCYQQPWEVILISLFNVT